MSHGGSCDLEQIVLQRHLERVCLVFGGRWWHLATFGRLLMLLQ